MIFHFLVNLVSCSDNIEKKKLRKLNDRELQTCSFYVPASSNCFVPRNIGIGCNNLKCQNEVCNCDPYCCEVLWDSSCTESNYFNPGCTADNLCCKAIDLDFDHYSTGAPSLYGSGCSSNSVSPGELISLNGYQAKTNDQEKLVRKTCDYAIPIQVDSGYQIIVSGFYYGGNTVIPSQNSETRFSAENFFAGDEGMKITKSFKSNQSFSITNMNPVVSPCGGSLVFRMNTAIISKKSNLSNRDGIINVNQGFPYTITTRKC